MRLADYLAARGERPAAFARRAGIPWATLAGVMDGADARLSTARAIVRASRAEPTPDGGTVGWEDLAIAGAERAAANAPSEP
jgi:predicted transcriptional regulator